MPDPLHSLADLATSLGGVSAKTARRHLGGAHALALAVEEAAREQ